MTDALVHRLKDELFIMLDETFERVHGQYLDRGTSLFETLATISAAEASRPVSANCASIAAQVNHVRFYLDVLTEAIQRELPEKIDWSEAWRMTTVDEAGWATLQAALHASHQRTLGVLHGIDDWAAENPIAGALAILVHTAYHLGEIRQALCTVRGAV